MGRAGYVAPGMGVHTGLTAGTSISPLGFLEAGGWLEGPPAEPGGTEGVCREGKAGSPVPHSPLP